MNHADLRNFTGTEQYHVFNLIYRNRVVATDGAMFVANNAGGGAYWLLEAIASYQNIELDRRCGGFQVWTLTPKPTDASPRRAILTCQKDSGEANLVTQVIEYTDFPFNNGEPFQFWVEGTNEQQVILLPSEH